MTTADYLNHHYLSWDSVIREFEIITEASKYLFSYHYHLSPKFSDVKL